MLNGFQNKTEYYPFVERTAHTEKDIQLMLHEFYKQDFEVQLQTQGITNRLYKCTTNDLTCLVRIYGNGTELFLNRQEELELVHVLSHRVMYSSDTLQCKGMKNGEVETAKDIMFAEPIYATFQNGVVYGFVPGEVMTPETLLQYTPPLVRSLRLLHRLSFEVEDRAPILFTTMQKYYDLVLPETFEKAGMNQRDVLKSMRQMESRITQLCPREENSRSLSKSDIVFCHNDLLPANIILTQQQLKFIDFEYAGWNYRWYDIANHMNEYAGLECDWSKVPNRDWIYRFVELYASVDGVVPQESELNVYTDLVMEFMPVSHLFWSVWALAQAQLSDLDFGYAPYAKLRWNGFLMSKRE
jgi:ethanolamine kinase